MRNSVILLVVAIAGVFGYYIFWPDTTESVVERAPGAAEQFAAVFASEPVKAARISSLFMRFPDKARREFRDRLVRISGDIESIRLSGVGRDRAELLLADGGPAHVRITLDLKKYNTTTTYANASAHYELVGSELLFFSTRGAHRTVLFREGQSVNQRARFTHATNSEICFTAE